MSRKNASTIAADPRLRVPARILSNGRYAVLLTHNGGGMAALDGFALTRWSADPLTDADGAFLYVRDRDSGAYWSASPRPVIDGAGVHTTHRASDPPCYERGSTGIDTCLEIGVAAGRDLEVRRLRITNAGATPRRLAITSYAELVLDAPLAHAAHPAFSRLFVQTAYDAPRGALLAWRRLRNPDDRPLCFGHRMIGGDATTEQYETDRARFLDRGRTPAAPGALTAPGPLAGTTGNVLDPVFALRRTLTLEPGETSTISAVYAAAGDLSALEALLDGVAAAGDVDAVLAGAAPASGDGAHVLGVPDAWLDTVALDAGWETSDGDAATPGDGVDENESWPAAPERAAVATPASTLPDGSTLTAFNGHGGFTADGSEYVVRVPCDDAGARLPPMPWANVIANEEAGCIVSERGSVYTWAANSRENRITPWFNDPVGDPTGEAFYVRDDEDGAFHSLAPAPAPAAGVYDVHHGFGYTRFHHAGPALAHEMTLFVPRSDPLRIARIRVTNTSSRARAISLYGYAQLVLGVHPAASRGLIVTEHDEATDALLARNAERAEYSERVAFARAVSDGAVHRLSGDRAAFLGAHGDLARPAALQEDVLERRVGRHPDACAALQVTRRLGPGETLHCAFLLGEATDGGAARAVLHRYPDVDAVDDALADVCAFWRDLLAAVRVETPAPELDLLLNGWLSYQNLSCRMWARSAFYQSGGAFGFRDQLQDSSALLYLDPALTRGQIVLHAEHQFVEGDVLHWWHPPSSKGIRTRFSDDLLWLPYITAFYLRSTGDSSVLDESARFLAAPLLEPDEDEVLLVPSDSGTSASVFEHCCRSIDRSLTRGAHGLPLIGVGDWNDGMNRVGREGRGESVWLGFFLYDILHDFIPLCEQRGESVRAARYRAYHRDLGRALNDAGWDGAWYRRAYYDDGTPLGASASDECRIDTIAQAWAVLSGAAPTGRAALALDAMEQHLVSEDEGIIRLLTPPFDRTPHDPGYIKGYLPGVRENGGQYTHGALWAVRALAEAGRNERAARLLSMLSPVAAGRTAAGIATYQAEPYVVAADVYGVEPHVGRGGWSWYTGSAGWMFRVALESVLGLTLDRGESILLRPCIPAAWPGFRVCYRLPDGTTTYALEVVQGERGAGTEATLDGASLAIRDRAVVVPLVRDAGTHEVRVRLGGDVGPRYAPRPA